MLSKQKQFERFNNMQYFSDNFQVPYQPNADLIVNNLSEILHILFYENRIQAELYDHMLTYGLYRCSLFIYVHFLYSVMRGFYSFDIQHPLCILFYQLAFYPTSVVTLTVCKLKRKII